jgi:nitrite reductase (NADH) small subunit
MLQAVSPQETIQWITVCSLVSIAPNSGVCALINGEQVAVFRVGDRDLYALSNFDPFSKANVISRGIVGDRSGIPKVASPIYKQNFNLATGQCFDDESVSLKTFPVQLVDDRVQVGVLG